MLWSPQQDRARKKIRSWLRKGERQVFLMTGYAGTGKSTLAAEVGNEAVGAVWCAPTGKAAQVLRQMDCQPAMTIHRLIYHAVYNEIFERYEFELKPRDEIDASLIIVDECSMVDSRVATDLVSLRIPILAIGDPFQLPPVNDATSYFMDAVPDVMLTEIHRHARDNPILRLADGIRRGEPIPKPGFYEAGADDEVEVVDLVDDEDAVRNFDVVLCGRNETRQRWNRRLRRKLGFGRSGENAALPQQGETVLCLRNDYKVLAPVFNGSQWHVEQASPSLVNVDGQNTPIVSMEISSEHEGISRVQVPTVCFTDPNALKRLPRGLQKFDYGYALTTHKAQGSEWLTVLLENEARFFREDARRWLYTGITRARQRLVIVDYS